MLRRFLLFQSFIYLSIFIVSGQTLSDIDTGKYRINLPERWKPGSKVWQILSDKLPLVCDELKEKEICGDDCNPKYRIEFYISQPVIFNYYPNHISSDYTNNLNGRPTERWDFVTYYGFECSLLLFDEKNTLLTRFILVDTNETWNVKKRATLISFSPPPPQKIILRKISSSQSVLIDANNPNLNNVEMGETPYSYIINNKDKLCPDINNMLTIVDNKIRSWQ